MSCNKEFNSLQPQKQQWATPLTSLTNQTTATNIESGKTTEKKQENLSCTLKLYHKSYEES